MATGATVGITVADPDGNIDSGAVETLQAEVRNVDRPGQVRTEVVLTETTPGSALFTGEVLVRQSAVRPTIFLGPSTSINVQPGDDVSVSYSSIGGAGSLVRAATFYVQVVGTITVHPLPLVPGEVALITLQDDDLDRKGVLDQVRVRVTSSREDEPPKEVKLRETGPSTGDFTGALQTVRSEVPGSIAAAGEMHVQEGAVLTVAYEDALPLAQTVTRSVPLAIAGRLVIAPSPLRREGSVRVTLLDADVNQDFAAPETVGIDVSVAARGIARVLELRESAAASGVFTGALDISEDDPAVSLAPLESTLQPVTTGDVVTMVYVDAVPPGVVEERREVLESALASLHLDPAATLLAGAQLALTVVDADLNSKEPSTVTVLAESLDRDDAVTVVLRKVTPYSTTYTGVLDTELADMETDKLWVAAGDRVRLTYADPSPRHSISAEVAIAASAAGEASVNTTRVLAGGALLVTVRDIDMDLNVSALDTLTVTGRTQLFPSQPQTYELTETGVSSGTFTGEVSTALWNACVFDGWGCTGAQQIPAGDVRLYVEQNGAVLLRYTDRAPAGTADVSVPVCTAATIEGHPLVIAIGWNLLVKVVDPDRAGTGAVNASVRSTVDTVVLRLDEDPEAPGTFSAAIDSVLSEAPTGDGRIAVITDSEIDLAYEDECPPASVSLQVRAHVLGELDFGAPEFKVGERLSLRVRDRNARAQAGPVAVRSVSAKCSGALGDKRVVALTEVGPDAGVFTASMLPGTTGELSAIAGAAISCEYPLEQPPTLLEASSMAVPSVVGVLAAAPGAINIGGVITLSVTDFDLNTDPAAAETHAGLLSVRSSVTGDVKHLSLTEVGVSSSIFTAKVIAAHAAVSSPLQTVLTTIADNITATYTDLAPVQTKTVEIPVKRSNVGVIRINPSGLVRVGSVPQVIVVDADLNADSAAVEHSEATVTIRTIGFDGICASTGFCFPMNAMVTLTEMGPDSPFFTGTLFTAYTEQGRSKGVSDPANLVYLTAGHQATLSYYDAAPEAVRTSVVPVVASQVGTIAASPAIGVAGQQLFITVTDADLEYDPGQDVVPSIEYAAGPANCELFPKNEGCLDRGRVLLKPTGEGAVTFTGAVTPVDGSAVGQDGPCFLACQDITSQQGELISFTYTDEAPFGTDFVTVKIASLAKLSINKVGVGGPVVVTLVDNDEDQDTASIEHASVIVEAGAVSRELPLTETSSDSGTFTGSIMTSSGSSDDLDVIPEVSAGMTIKVLFNDLLPVERTVEEEVTVLASALGNLSFSSSGPLSNVFVVRGHKIIVTLSDNDINYDPLAPDDATVRATTSREGQGSETLLLREQGYNTGLFTGDLDLTLGTFNALPDNGAIDVFQGDFITVAYDDQYPGATVETVVRIASTGQMTLVPSPISIGFNVNVTVVDADLNLDPAAVDTGEVVIRNGDSDTEVVVLTEIAHDSSTFTGTLTTTDLTTQVVGRLDRLIGGTFITATYADVIPAYDAAPVCPTCVISTRVAMPGNLSASLELLPVGGSFLVTLVDSDGNLDTEAVETVRVTATQYFTEPNDSREILLIETGLDTNQFTGEIATSVTYGETDIYAPEGSRIRIDYEDVAPLPGETRSTIVRVSMIGRVVLGPSPLNANAVLTITVIDNDMDRTPGTDQGDGLVVVKSENDAPANPQGVARLLQETGPQTGIFTGDIPTQVASSNTPGIIMSSAVPGSYITVTYEDGTPSGVRTEQVRIASNATMTLLPAEVDEGATLVITVTDADIDDDPLVVESIELEFLQTTDPPDAVNVTLFETGLNTATFTASLETSDTAQDGKLHAPEGSLISVSYTDRNPTPSRVLTETRRVSILGSIPAVGPAVPTPVECVVDNADPCDPPVFTALTITVRDSDLDEGLPAVTVYNTRGLEYETVTMAETDVTFTFTGVLAVTEDASIGTSDSGALNVQQGDRIQVSYADAAPPVNVMYDYVVPTIANVRFEGTELIAGKTEPLIISVSDFDSRGSSSLLVTVTGSVGNDVEVVSMSETATAGEFTGALPTFHNQYGVTVNDGTLQVDRNDQVKVLFKDTTPPPETTLGRFFGTSSVSFRGKLETSAKIILPNEPVSITLVDCDLMPSNPDDAVVKVGLEGSVDRHITLTLALLDDTCGIFTGSVSTVSRETYDTAKINLAAPGTRVETTYFDCSDNEAQTMYVRIATTGVVSFNTTGNVAGLPVAITLDDGDLNVDPAAAETATVVVTKASGGDEEVVTLGETGVGSGVFTGLLDTSALAGASSDGVLNGVRRGETVLVRYHDAQPAVNVTDRIELATEAGAVLVPAAHRTFPAAEGFVTITVQDADLNEDPYEVEMYAAHLGLLTVTSANDTELIALVETARNSAVFTGQIPTTLAPVTPHDGALSLRADAAAGSIVYAAYADPQLGGAIVPPRCSTWGIAHACATGLLRVEHNASLLLSHRFGIARIGETLEVRLLDGDLNQDVTAPEAAAVQVNASSGESATLVLRETGGDTGVFTAAAPVAAAGTLAADLLAVPPLVQNPLTPGTLSFSYRDSLPAGHEQTTELTGGYLGSLASTFNALNPGGAMRIELSDFDLNLAHNAPNTVEGILVTSAMTNQYETVSLVETGANTGVFTGVLHTSVDPTRGIDFSGRMHVQSGDLLNVRYNDQAPATPVERAVRIATRAELAHAPLLLWVGGTLTVSVSDADMDRNVLAPDSIPASLVTLRVANLKKQLQLVETAPSSGVFTGTVTLTTGVMGAGSFGPVQPGDHVTVTYDDPMPLDGISITLPVFEKGVATSTPSTWVDAGEEAVSVTVVDADLNRDPETVEVLDEDSRLVWVDLNGLVNSTVLTALVDREYLEVTETGPDTGVFTGSVPTSDSASAAFGSGVVSPLVSGFAVTAHYLDTAPIQTSKYTTFPGFPPSSFTVLPASLGAGGKIAISLADSDVNLDYLTVETVDVTVRTDRVREPPETVTLVETGANTGQFTGELQTVLSSSFSQAGDGVLNAFPGDCPLDCATCAAGTCAGYLVTTYADVTPRADVKRYTALRNRGTINACWPGSRPTDVCTFQTGSVLATVYDPDLNLNPALREEKGSIVSARAEFWSHVTNSLVTSATVSIALVEAGVDSGTFTGEMSTLTSAQSGILQIFDQDDIRRASTVVTMTYMNAKSEYPTATTRLMTDGAASIAALDGSSSLPVGEDFIVTVQDGDMDYSRYAPDTVQVTLWAGSEAAGSSGNRDEQVWTLTETGNSTGVFTGRVPTEMGTPVCDDATIQVFQEPGAKVRALYSELAPDGGITTNPVLTAMWPGAISSSPGVVKVTDTVTITLQERDLHSADCATTGAAPVVTFDSPDGVLAGASATLSASSCGVWAGTYQIQNSYGAPSGTKRSTVYARYTDASHGGAVRTTAIQVVPRPVLIIRPFEDAIDQLSLTVLDSYADATDYVDTLSVNVATYTGGTGPGNLESETVTLTETGASTATFTGKIAMVVAPFRDVGNSRVDGDLAGLASVASPALTAEYVTDMYTISESQDIGCVGKVILPHSFTPTGVVQVTVSDCDLQAADATITVTAYMGGASKDITLSRDAASDTAYAQTYSGSFTTDEDPGASVDFPGVISLDDWGSRIAVKYQDARPAAAVWGSTTASVAGVLTAETTFNNRSSVNSRFKVGEKAFLQVADRDANRDNSTVETVTVLAEGLGDAEVLLLQETSPNSSIYTGWLPMDAGVSTVRGDGRISPAVAGGAITLTYLDAAPTMNVTVGLTGSDYQRVALAPNVDALSGVPVVITVVDGDLDTEPDGGVLRVAACTRMRVCDRSANCSDPSESGALSCTNCSDVAAARAPECWSDFCDAVDVSLSASPTSGVFVGQMPVATCLENRNFSRNASFYFVCTGLDECNVTATYTDETWGPFLTTGAASRTGILAVASTPGAAVAGSMVLGEPLHVTVTDADADVTSDPDSLAVAVDPSGGSGEILSLLETARSSGVFTGTMQTRAAVAIRHSAENVTAVAGGSVSVTYSDAAPASWETTRSLQVLARATVSAGPVPVLTSSQGPATSGIQLTVNDAHASGGGGVSAVVTSYATNLTTLQAFEDSVTVALTETGVGTGTFTGAVGTTEEFDTDDNAVYFKDNPSFRYKVQYFQPGTGGGGSSREPVAFCRLATDATLSAAGTVRAGELLRITVTDNDRDLDWDLIDSVQVSVSTSKSFEGSELVTLHETSATNATVVTFTGALLLYEDETAGGANDGRMNAMDGDTITISYSELYRGTSGSARALAASVAVAAGGVQGQVRLVDPTSLAPSALVNEGQSLWVLVSDPDGDASVLAGSLRLATPTAALEAPPPGSRAGQSLRPRGVARCRRLPVPLPDLGGRRQRVRPWRRGARAPADGHVPRPAAAPEQRVPRGREPPLGRVG